MRKAMSAFLSVLILFCTFPLSASASVARWRGGEGTITVSQNGGTLYFADLGSSVMLYESENLSGDVTIPSYVNGKPVTALYYENGPQSGMDGISYHCLCDPHSTMTSLTLPATLKEFRIGEDSNHYFFGGNSLKKITFLGNGPTVIPSDCFAMCGALETVTLPADTEEIGDSAFAECSKLQKIYNASHVTKAGKHLFRGCTELNPFEDSYNKWSEPYIKWAYQNNILLGTSAFSFSPDTNLTRGMLVTALYRLEGEPRVSLSKQFKDVSPTAYYAKAVSWASQNAVAVGYNSEQFAPDERITREQMMAMIYRYAKIKQKDVDLGKNSVSSFSDYDQVSSFARDAVDWAVDRGIVSGKGNGKVDPKGPTTRAEASTVMSKLSANNQI